MRKWISCLHHSILLALVYTMLMSTLAHLVQVHGNSIDTSLVDFPIQGISSWHVSSVLIHFRSALHPCCWFHWMLFNNNGEKSTHFTLISGVYKNLSINLFELLPSWEYFWWKAAVYHKAIEFEYLCACVCTPTVSNIYVHVCVHLQLYIYLYIYIIKCRFSLKLTSHGNDYKQASSKVQGSYIKIIFT